MVLNVAVEIGSLGNGHPAFLVKLSCDHCELNIWVPVGNIDVLKDVTNRSSEHGATRVGTSAGSDVYWLADGDKVSILVGHDDQTWDFGVTTDINVVGQIIEQAKTEQVC